MPILRPIVVLALLTSLALSLAGCGGPDGAPSSEPTADSGIQPPTTAEERPLPTPTSTPRPTSTPEPTPTEVEALLNTTALSTPADLASYRSSLRVVIEGTDNGRAIQGVLQVLMEYKRAPFVQHVVISGEGFEQAELPGGLELYRTAGSAYLKLGEEWLSLPAAEDDPLAGVEVPGARQVLAGTCGWRRRGDTEYQGIQVQHWTLDQQDLQQCLTPGQLAALGEPSAASGDLYVATEGNYVAELSLVFEGKNLRAGVGSPNGALDQGRLAFKFEMIDINEPFSIDLPDEARSSE